MTGSTELIEILYILSPVVTITGERHNAGNPNYLLIINVSAQI
jgi:hypothetical protein